MHHRPQPATLPVPAPQGAAPHAEAIVAVVEPGRDDSIRDATVRDEQTAAAAGMRLLSAGVPLTLLLDLSLPLDSRAISAAEGGSASWLRP
ncbi:MAG: hypothetical protein M3P95_00185 [Actinomycetota bacterium]|nr:hypothetical protein [Actinomycetota bacterium]